jgi:hypothetical protein
MVPNVPGILHGQHGCHRHLDLDPCSSVSSFVGLSCTLPTLRYPAADVQCNGSCLGVQSLG